MTAGFQWNWRRHLVLLLGVGGIVMAGPLVTLPRTLCELLLGSLCGNQLIPQGRILGWSAMIAGWIVTASAMGGWRKANEVPGINAEGHFRYDEQLRGWIKFSKARILWSRIWAFEPGWILVPPAVTFIAVLGLTHCWSPPPGTEISVKIRNASPSERPEISLFGDWTSAHKTAIGIGFDTLFGLPFEKDGYAIEKRQGLFVDFPAEFPEVSFAHEYRSWTEVNAEIERGGEKAFLRVYLIPCRDCGTSTSIVEKTVLPHCIRNPEPYCPPATFQYPESARKLILNVDFSDL